MPGTAWEVQQAAPAAYNVKSYGAAGDGVTDDSAAILAAITAAKASGGQVYFPAGTYVFTPQTVYSKVWWVGDGYEATILLLKAGSNADFLVTNNFATLTGTNSTGGEYNWGMRDLTIDGNSGNNTGTGRGLVIYGYGYSLTRVRIRNTNGDGMYSEWSNSASNPGHDSMEAHIQDFKIHATGAIGLNFNGPHDSDFVSGEIFGTGRHGVYVGPNAPGTNFTQVHAWGMATGNSSLSWLLEAGVNCANCTAEGSDTCEVVALANGTTWTGGAIFGSNIWTNSGVQAGQAAGGTPYYGSSFQSGGLTTAQFVQRCSFVGCRMSLCLSPNGALNLVNHDYWHFNFMLDETGGGKLFGGTNGITVNDQLFVTVSGGSGASNLSIFHGGAITAFGNQSSTTLSTGSTITFNGTVFICTATGAITGVKINSGSYSGQMLVVKNVSSFTMTFDVQANSHVAGGASVVVQPQSVKILFWDNPNGLWYPQA